MTIALGVAGRPLFVAVLFRIRDGNVGVTRRRRDGIRRNASVRQVANRADEQGPVVTGFVVLANLPHALSPRTAVKRVAVLKLRPIRNKRNDTSNGGRRRRGSRSKHLTAVNDELTTITGLRGLNDVARTNRLHPRYGPHAMAVRIPHVVADNGASGAKWIGGGLRRNTRVRQVGERRPQQHSAQAGFLILVYLPNTLGVRGRPQAVAILIGIGVSNVDVAARRRNWIRRNSGRSQVTNGG